MVSTDLDLSGGPGLRWAKGQRLAVLTRETRHPALGDIYRWIMFYLYKGKCKAQGRFPEVEVHLECEYCRSDFLRMFQVADTPESHNPEVRRRRDELRLVFAILTA